MPKLSEGLPILTDTIKLKLRHPDYDHVVKLAQEMTMYATGKGIESELKRFNGRETEELFIQRVALTMCNTPDLVNSCNKPLKKVTRTPAIFNVTWPNVQSIDEANKKKKELFDAANKFWGQKSAQTYLTDRVPSKDKCDPNAWMIIEFKETYDPANPDAKINPYPFEVSAAEAINFYNYNNVLQWIIVLRPLQILDDEGKVNQGEKYFTYLDNHNITATEIHRTMVKNWKIQNPYTEISSITNLDSLKPGVNYLFNTGEPEEKNRRYFIINVFETKIGYVPAMIFGTETDEETDHRTRVPVINPARSYFKDSIQTMSEFGITKRLHVFPQKFQYLPKCTECFNGKEKDGMTLCKTCKGSGTVTHASAQDIIGIKMPDELKDIVNLDFMASYKGPAIDLITFQKEFGFEDTRRYAISAVYSNEVGKRRVKTATEADIDFEAVYDTIKSYADHFSDMYVFIHRTIAILRNIGKEIEITHQFPDDFQMQSVSEILIDIKGANDSGAPSFIKKELNRKLAQKIYIDQPRKLLMFDTKDKFYPFAGKSETEISFIIANGKTLRRFEVLYVHFDEIFSELEYETSLKNVDFYELDEAKQRELIKQKVDEFIKELDDTAAKAVAGAFGGAPSDIPAA